MQNKRIVQIPAADRWAKITNADRWKRNVVFVEDTPNQDALERLFDVIRECGIDNYFRQGALPDEKAYPNDDFVTFWQQLSTPTHYNNKLKYVVLRWSIAYYTRHADVLYSNADKLMKAFENAGYTIMQYTADIDTDRPDYYARAFEIKEVITC